MAKTAKIAKNAVIVEIAKMAKIEEVEKVIVLKTFKICGFFEEKDAFFEKIFSRWQVCCTIRIKWLYFINMSSALFKRSFGKNQKKLERWKI